MDKPIDSVFLIDKKQLCYVRKNKREVEHTGRCCQIRCILLLQWERPEKYGQRHWRYRIRYLSYLYRRRQVRLPAQDPADQFLHLRLRLLRVPQQQRYQARCIYRRRGRSAHYEFLP